MPENKPIVKFTAGAVSCSVWKNIVRTEKAEFDNYSVNLQRAYKDAKGEWQHTDSMKSNDIPKAILVLQKAYDFINTKKDDIA